MKNFVQEGNALDFVAPEGGVIGGVLYVSPLVHVAAKTAAEDEKYSGWTEGVYELPALAHADAQGIVQGGQVYWDTANSRCTKTAAGNTLIGTIANPEGKVSTDVTAKVKLLAFNANIGAAIADINLGAVAGVDGAGNNAASKADVDARMVTINNKINAIIGALEAHGIIAG